MGTLAIDGKSTGVTYVVFYLLEWQVIVITHIVQRSRLS